MKAKTVEEYLDMVPKQGLEMLLELREILKNEAPKNAQEVLKWGLPVFEEKRILYAYAGYKAHITFTPTASALAPFLNELAGQTVLKDSIKFEYGSVLPKELIQKIAAYRVQDVKENDARWIG